MSNYKFNKLINTVDECLTNGANNGIFHVSVEDNHLNGRTVTIDGKEVVNFGSCSYLGLEVDDRLKEGAIEATRNYGTQYSSSRAFSACNLYEELEDLFYKIFDNNPSILAATTTLSHVAAIPIIVQDNDLLILDHQVHGSVQLAAQLVKARGTRVEMIRHNRMDMLEDLIKENPNKYNKIWYMADGLYSMYGDYAPLKEIRYLLEKYSTFHFYVDDAHGMSWAGKNGNGYVLSQMPMHPKMVLTTSLAKGFGTGGGVTVLPDGELRRKILTCGSSYTFSGPVQPPMLGASIASAKIHLTKEIYELQYSLRSKIDLANNLINQYGLPLAMPTNSPIFYLGLGLPRVGYNMVKRLMGEGFYANIGIFPAAPINCTGLRLPITNGQTDDDIKGILGAFQYHFPLVMEEEGMSVEKISHSFKLPFEETKKRYSAAILNGQGPYFDIQHETTIHNIDKTVWDELLGDAGIFDWEGCRFIEETFSDNPEPENNWNIHYLIIRDRNGKPILATYFTELLCKDDLIAPASVSEQIEEIRKKDKYHLTSRVIMMGSLFTVGDHLYLDRKSGQWKQAVLEMLRIMNEEKQKCGAAALQLRDFDTEDVEIQDFLIQEGFIKIEMPDTHILTDTSWGNEDEYMNRLSTKARWHFRRNILDKRDFFNITRIPKDEVVSSERVEGWRMLYANVQQKSFNINTYPLPIKYFKNIVEHPNWEVIELRLRAPVGDDPAYEPLVSVGFCYKSSRNNYSIMAVGLDYNYVVSHGGYRQNLYQSVVRANELKCNKLFFGMDASIEKRKFGVKVIPKSVYVQASDNFNMELIGVIQNNSFAHNTNKVAQAV
jgi:7-keto-8-aminopelargonate synthetase-like enzyme